LSLEFAREELPAFTPFKEKDDYSKFSITPLSTIKKITFSPMMTTMAKIPAV